MSEAFNPEHRVARLRVAQQKLQEAEAEYARVAAEYRNLELLLRKQQKQQLVEHEQDSRLSCKSTSETATTTLKGSLKVDERRTKNRNSRPLGGRTATKLPSKSTTMITKTGWQNPGGREALRNGDLLKRIQQCHENLNSLASLSEKSTADKTKFLKQLDKVNSKSWKLLKSRIPSIK